MSITLQLHQLDVPPGQRLHIRNLDWQQFERILEELGDAALGVPELWRYEKNQLNIYVLQAGQYQRGDTSPTFPTLPILDFVAEVLEQSLVIGRSPALRAFRRKLRLN